MSQVAVTDIAKYFDPDHAMAGVALFADAIWLDGLEIAWPATTRVKLGVGGKQRGATADATINPILIVVPVATGEGALGAFHSGNGIFLRGQLGPPLGICFMDFLHIGGLSENSQKGSRA